jgi:hypothetical protein
MNAVPGYQPDPLISIARVRAEFIDQSDMWFKRSIANGTFPASCGTIGRARHWRLSDLVAWRDGKRSGWVHVDPDAATRRRKAQHLVDALLRRHGKEVPAAA